MPELIQEIYLYHGSYVAVPEIDLEKCNPGLDFGLGFYKEILAFEANKGT